jgi:hypothetical protein
MIARNRFFGHSWFITAALIFTSSGTWAASPSTNLNELGPEGRALAAQTGVWDVIETVWATPDARPIVSKGVAVRRMIGPLLEETLYQGAVHPESDLSEKAINRIDYLSFNRLEGRWNYVSMDVRAPVGIMTANSFDRDPVGHIQVTFLPFAFPGGKDGASGQLLRMDEVVETHADGTTTKEQHFILADGTGRKWLAHRYTYTRRATK